MCTQDKVTARENGYQCEYGQTQDRRITKTLPRLARTIFSRFHEQSKVSIRKTWPYLVEKTWRYLVYTCLVDPFTRAEKTFFFANRRFRLFM